MQFTPFKTQYGRLAAWPRVQVHRNAAKLATDYAIPCFLIQVLNDLPVKTAVQSL